MKKGNRWAAVILAAILFSVLLFSYQYILNNAYHNCSGEDCPVCMQLEMAAHNIANIKFVPVLLSVWSMFCVFKPLRVRLYRSVCLNHTLVSSKVKLII